MSKRSEYFCKEHIQRTQRHMNKCSASPAIRETQMKATVRYPWSHWPSLINQQTAIAGEDVEEREPWWWERRLVQPLWKTVRNFLKKLKMDLPFDPAIPLLGIYPKNPETPIQKIHIHPYVRSSVIFNSQGLETA